MNKLQVQSYDWLVENGYAFPIGKPGSQFSSQLDDGTYLGDQLEPVWQYKKPGAEWWDNLPGEPDAMIRNNYQVRLLIRERTNVTEAIPDPTFQQRVLPWLIETFGAKIASDITERNQRFLEEALELVQSTGCTSREAHELVDYVFNRPAGAPYQEVGGVMVTLAGLCLATGLDMADNGETELSRVWTKVEQIRAKQATRPKYSPLPQ